MWVVVGLGNPGNEYADTRHNVGFKVVDELLRRGGVRATRGPGDYVAGTLRSAGVEALLCKPTTYVNRTGRALRQLAMRREIVPGALLAVVDDVYLPFGRLRLRPAGGAGGHNGMRSIIEVLGTEDFPRLRMGVGAPEDGTPLEDWVTSPFPADESEQLPAFVSRAADAVLLVLERGVEAALPEVNRPLSE